jgi:hypothetical protein
MGLCFLHGHGPCGGKISREHYISETVLRAVGSNGSVQIGGLPWQPKDTLQCLGIGSLVANVLCEKHNSGLSGLDDAAGEFFRTLNSADKQPDTLPPITTLSGALIERWFLKTMCGLASGPGLNNGVVPEQWKLLLLGEEWPEGWGMYAPMPAGGQVLANEFAIESLVNPETREIKACRFRVAGVHFNLVLGRPNIPSAWGVHRPGHLIFRRGTEENGITLTWPIPREQGVTYTKVGTTKERPPQWASWKE